jgi:hypothetical protein
MRSSRRSRSADADDGSRAASAEEAVVDEAMRKRYAADRGLSPFATWDEITAHDSEKRRARLDSLASPPAVVAPAPSGLVRTESVEASMAQMAQRNCELELLVGKLQEQLRESMDKAALLSSTFAREQAALKDARLSEARHRLSAAANISARLATVQTGAAALVNAVPIDQQEALRAPALALEQSVDGLRESLEEMVGVEQQLVEEADSAAVAPEPAAVPSVSLAEAASDAGLAESDAVLRQQQLVAVSGVTEARALELLSMADFDINRAAEFHFKTQASAPMAAPDGGQSDQNLLPAVQLFDATDTSLPLPPPVGAEGDDFLLTLGTTGPALTGLSLPLAPDAMQLVVRLQARVRGGCARRSHRKRSQIARELLLTEQSFYQGLQQIITVYLRPLTKLSNAGHEASLSAADRRAIFSEVEALAVLHHTQLLSGLMERMDRWCMSSVIGDLFSVVTIESLKIHTVWANNYFSALAALKRVKEENPDLQAWLFQQQQRGGAGSLDAGQAGARLSLALEDYLIMPIQRIPRYVMLLRELYRYTPPIHPDHLLLRGAIDRVSELAEHVNESKRQSESRERVSAIAAAFGRGAKKKNALPTSYRGAPFELMTASRTWLRDGDFLETTARGGADLKMKTCFLFNDLLVIADAMERGKTVENVASLRFSRMITIGPTTVLTAEWITSPFYKPGRGAAKTKGKKPVGPTSTGRIDPTESQSIPVLTITTHHDDALSGDSVGAAQESAILLPRDEQQFQHWHKALQAAVSWQSMQRDSYRSKAQARSRRHLSNFGHADKR